MASNFEQINQKNNIHNLLEILRKRVKHFTVIDSQGQLVGKVKDLVLDTNHQLNIVITEQNIQGQQPLDKHSLIILRSQKIKKIDNETKSVFLDVNKSEIMYMPEYLGTQTPGDNKIVADSTEQPLNSQITNSQVEPINIEKVEEAGEENTIRLLEERLVVDSRKRKVGEVIVRKEIETRIVQVPVRREKLIVEQVSPEHKQLAEIDLGQEEISGIELSQGESTGVSSFDNGLTVSGEFSSPKTASLLLNAIALERNHGCQQVRVSITVADESTQKKYEEWFARCSQGQQTKRE